MSILFKNIKLIDLSFHLLCNSYESEEILTIWCHPTSAHEKKTWKSSSKWAQYFTSQLHLFQNPTVTMLLLLIISFVKREAWVRVDHAYLIVPVFRLRVHSTNFAPIFGKLWNIYQMQTAHSSTLFKETKTRISFSL